MRYEQRGDEAESARASATCQSEPYVPLSQAEIDAMTIPKSLLFEDLVEVRLDDYVNVDVFNVDYCVFMSDGDS